MAEYRLQTLLQLRQRTEQAAKEEFARALGRLKKEEERLNDLQEELKAMEEKRKDYRKKFEERIAKGAMQVHDQASTHQFIQRLKRDEEDQEERIANQKEIIEDVQRDVKKAQAALVTAAQELKALEKHREKWVAELKKERMLKEEDNLDEVAQTLFRMQKENE